GPGSGRADVAVDRHHVDRLVLDDVPRLRGVDHLAVADVQPDVADVVVEEHQVARLELVARDLGADGHLVPGDPGDLDAGRAPGGLGQPRAVVGVGAGGAPDVRLAELRLGEGDGLVGERGVRAVGRAAARVLAGVL